MPAIQRRMAGLNPDYCKRDYLLPPGCKDLIDVLRLEKRPPPGAKLLELRDHMSLRDLAALLGCRPFKLVVDLLEWKIQVHVDHLVSFPVAAKLAEKHGFVARRAY